MTSLTSIFDPQSTKKYVDEMIAREAPDGANVLEIQALGANGWVEVRSAFRVTTAKGSIWKVGALSLIHI